MKKLIAFHRNMRNIITGGNFYHANTLLYLRRKSIDMDVIDWSKVRRECRNNRFLLIVKIFIFYLKHKKNIFSLANHNLYFYLLIPFFFSRIMGNKYGCGCHLSQYNLRKNFFMRQIEFLFEFLMLQGASLLILPSKAAILQFEKFRISPKKICIINPAPNVVGQGKTTYRRPVRNIAFVGNIEWRKGLDVLLKALGGLRDLQLHINIAGKYDVTSSYYRNIQQIVKEYKLSDNITFHGYLPPTKISLLYKNADLFVFPSRQETFGMVLMEALSFGLPIVASTLPSTVALIKHNANGLLYDTEDSTALAQAIRTLATDFPLRYSIIKNNIKQSKKLRTWDDVGAENYEVILPFLKKEC